MAQDPHQRGEPVDWPLFVNANIPSSGHKGPTRYWYHGNIGKTLLAANLLTCGHHGDREQAGGWSLLHETIVAKMRPIGLDTLYTPSLARATGSPGARLGGGVWEKCSGQQPTETGMCTGIDRETLELPTLRGLDLATTVDQGLLEPALRKWKHYKPFG